MNVRRFTIQPKFLPGDYCEIENYRRKNKWEQARVTEVRLEFWDRFNDPVYYYKVILIRTSRLHLPICLIVENGQIRSIKETRI